MLWLEVQAANEITWVRFDNSKTEHDTACDWCGTVLKLALHVNLVWFGFGSKTNRHN